MALKARKDPGLIHVGGTNFAPGQQEVVPNSLITRTQRVLAERLGFTIRDLGNGTSRVRRPR